MPETANERALRLRNERRARAGLHALNPRFQRPAVAPAPTQMNWLDEGANFEVMNRIWGQQYQVNLADVELRVAAQQAAPQPAVPVVEQPVVQPKLPKEEDEMPERLANSFLVGCDPEFVVIDKPNKVLDTRTVGIGQRGEVGYDHSGLMLEVRPEAAKGTYALLRRIKRIIDTNEHLKKVSDKKWRAGALVKTAVTGNVDRVLTLGGHVHLDIPPVGYGVTDEETHNLRLSAMDRVTRYMEKLDILPETESATRRVEGAKMPPGSRYGQWGDWRTAGEHEGDGRRIRMEYRTPASWLYDQKAAFLLMTAIKLAAVSPQLAMDTLKVRNINFDAFKQFFELYRHKDTNARRALEKLLDPKTLKQLQADPDRDIRDAWKSMEF